MKFYYFILIHLFSLTLSAQLITQKNGKYGITNVVTGELLVAQQYDSIYQLQLRPRVLSKGMDGQVLPIFACISKRKIHLFNSVTNKFYNGYFDEIKLYRQMDEQGYGANPPKYTPYWVDCFMLRNGNYWGYISYKKEYSFHDKLEDNDVFNIVEPLYDDLKFVEEVYGYDSKKYTRTKRIVAAKKDSLWGAVGFETGDVIVPFRYALPIHSFYNSYDNRGFEFFSTNGGFIKYYVARKTWDSLPQIIINPEHPDISFQFDFKPEVNIYNEFGNQYLYIEPDKGQEGVLKLYNYNSGKQLLEHKHDSPYTNITTHRKIENILIIDESTLYPLQFRATWYNLSTGKEILFAEGKSYKAMNFKLSIENEVIVMKGNKTIGKISGEGAAMKIEWTTKKIYTKETFQKGKN